MTTKKKLKSSHCCKAVASWDSDPCCCPLKYEPSTRYYFMTAPRSLLTQMKKRKWPSYQLHYCPHCGKKFPFDLIEKRLEILRNEFQIDNPSDKNQKKLIPKEFKTDEWWRKRKL